MSSDLSPWDAARRLIVVPHEDGSPPAGDALPAGAVARTADAVAVAPLDSPIEPPSRVPARRWAARGWSPFGWLVTQAWPLPSALMLAMGLWGIRRLQFGWDELFTWSAATRSVAGLRFLVHNVDAVMAPYYLFMHLWVQVFGDSPLALRAPSLLAMIGSAAVVALIGRKLGGAVCGTGVGLLFAVVPAVSRFAQETRGFALATLGACLAILFLLRAMERPTWGRWAVYGVAVMMTGSGHLIAVLSVIGHALGVAWWFAESRDRRAWRWLVACGVGVAPLVPLAYRGQNQYGLQLVGVAIPNLAALNSLPAQVVGGATTAGALVTLALLGPLVLLRRSEGAERRRAVVVLLGVTFGSAVALWVASQQHSMWYPRYLLYTTPALALLAVLVLARVSARLALIAFLAVGLLALPDHLVLRQPLSMYNFNYPDPYPNWFPAPVDYDRAAQIMVDNYQPGDVLLYPEGRNRWQTLMFDYRMRAANRPRDVLVAASRESTGTFDTVECPDVKKCFGAPPRVWVIAANRPDDPLGNATKDQAALLRGTYTLRNRYLVEGMTIALYGRG